MADYLLPPDSFPSPEGPYILQPQYFPQSYSLAPNSPLVTSGTSGMMASVGSMGTAIYSAAPASPSTASTSGGLSASAAALAGGGGLGVGGPGSLPGTAGANIAGGQGQGAGGSMVTPPVWPIRAIFVTMMITGKSSEGKSGLGLGGLLGLGGGGGGGIGSKDDRNTSNNNDYEPSVQSSDNSNPQDGSNSYTHPSTGFGDHSGPGSLPSAAQSSLGMSTGGLGRNRNNKPKEPPRPKNNFRSTSSTFITRVQTHDAFVRLLSTPSQSSYEPPSTSQPYAPSQASSSTQPTKWIFLSNFKHLSWYLVDPTGKTKDSLMRITFSAPITAHTPCEGTKAPPVDPGRNGVDGRLDLIVGFASGDLVWIDPLVGRYSRLNKQGIAHASPVSQIRHHPSNPTIIYVLHADGLVFTYSLDREDVAATAAAMVVPWSSSLKAWSAQKSSFSAEEATLGGLDAERAREIAKAKDADRMFVWRTDDPNAGPSLQGGKPSQHAFVGKNPLAVWKVGTKGIKRFEFSPDGQVIAAVSDDGTLKIVDVANESILDTYAGYFGGLTCLAWSPDGRFVLTGGQDDLITIISPRESRVVARCQGHSSFVSRITFDRRRSNARGYRFGSVGEDGRIILWDFSSASLHRPRHAHGGTSHHRVSLSSSLSLSRRVSSAGHLPLEEEESPFGLRYHPAPMRGDVALIQPVAVCLTEPTVLTSLSFFGDSVATCSRMGHVRFWLRPSEKSRMPERRPGEAKQAMNTSSVQDSNAGAKDVKDRLRILGLSGRDSRKAVKA